MEQIQANPVPSFLSTDSASVHNLNSNLMLNATSKAIINSAMAANLNRNDSILNSNFHQNVTTSSPTNLCTNQDANLSQNTAADSITDKNTNQNCEAITTNINSNSTSNPIQADSSAILNSVLNANATQNSQITTNSNLDSPSNCNTDSSTTKTTLNKSTKTKYKTKKLKTDHLEPKTKASRQNGRLNDRVKGINGRVNGINLLNNRTNLLPNGPNGLLNGQLSNSFNVSHLDFLNGNHFNQFDAQQHLVNFNNANQDPTVDLLKIMNVLNSYNQLNMQQPNQQPQHDLNGLNSLANFGLNGQLNEQMNTPVSSLNQFLNNRPKSDGANRFDLQANDKLNRAKSNSELLNDNIINNNNKSKDLVNQNGRTNDANKNNQESNETFNKQCKSFLFDIRNNAVAQTIYKCTCCGKLTEFVEEARSHYHDNHLDQENPPSLNLQNLSNPFPKNFANLQDDASNYNNLTNGLNSLNNLGNLNNNLGTLSSSNQTDLNLSRCLSRLSSSSPLLNKSSSSNGTGLITQNNNTQEQQIINNLLTDRLNATYGQSNLVYPPSNNGYNFYQNEQQNNSDSCGGICSLEGSLAECNSPSLNLTGSPGKSEYKLNSRSISCFLILPFYFLNFSKR